MKNDALVSVVVPVYNVEPYITKCLESLCGQTYKNIEIIVVDDSSPDNSAKIVDVFGKKDSRIIYILKKNEGLGAARNTGIRNSHGDYICFVDSDDWVSLDYVERFVTTIQREETDVVISNMKYVYSDGTERPRTPKITKCETLSAREALSREFIGLQYKFHAPNKFCKKSILTDNDIWFPEGRLYEDVFTTYKFLMSAAKVALIPDYTYFYLQNRSGSIMNSKIEARRFTDMFDALNLIIHNSCIHAYALNDEVQALYVGNVMSLVNYIYPLVGRVPIKEIRKYRWFIISDKNYDMLTKKIWLNSRINTITKIRVWAIRYSFTLYCVAMRCAKKILKSDRVRKYEGDIKT